MANALDARLGRIDDGALRDAIAAEVVKLRSSKEFSLIFERHLPQSVRLLTHAIQVGSLVQDRASTSGSTWFVENLDGDQATLRDAEGESSHKQVTDLVVLKSFGEPIYPG